MGQEEESVSLVRRANIGRSHTTPLDREPDGGKVGKDLGEPKRKVSSHVLAEEERRVGLLENPVDLGPEVPLVVDSGAESGRAERLARVSTSDEIHCATPRAAVEGSEIVPDRSAIQRRLRHPFHEACCGESVPLDHAHGAAPSGQAEIEATDAGAER